MHVLASRKISGSVSHQKTGEFIACFFVQTRKIQSVSFLFGGFSFEKTPEKHPQDSAFHPNSVFPALCAGVI